MARHCTCAASMHTNSSEICQRSPPRWSSLSPTTRTKPLDGSEASTCTQHCTLTLRYRPPQKMKSPMPSDQPCTTPLLERYTRSSRCSMKWKRRSVCSGARSTKKTPVLKYFSWVRWCSWLLSNALAIEASYADVFVTALPANLKALCFLSLVNVPQRWPWSRICCGT